MTNRAPLLVACLLLALPGCLGTAVGDKPEGAAAQPEPASEPGAEPQDPAPAGPAAAVPSADGPPVLALDSCPHAVMTAAVLPRALLSPDPPPGWDADPKPTTEVRLEAFRCERISIGPFERGPRSFLVETHDSGVPPPACAPDISMRARTIHQVWVDDADIAEYLTTEYGLPAKQAEFGFNRAVTGALVASQWTFGLPGQQPSALEATSWALDADHYSDVMRARHFWSNGQGQIGYLDFVEQVHLPGLARFGATGTIRPPLLYGHIESYASGDATPMTDVGARAQIMRFSDSQCEQPL